jgi:predicted flap endonuclease-1-like 5' DNA nuclease
MFDDIGEIIILLVAGLWSGILISWLYWRVRINNLEDIIGNLRTTTDAKDVDVSELKTLLHEQETKVNVLQDQMQQKEEVNLNLMSKNVFQEKSINDLKKDYTTLQRLNQEFGARIEKAEIRVEELNTSLKEREIMINTLKTRMELMQDNLTIIPGIGPKVSTLLRTAKIDTFNKLAATSVRKILEILEAENPNLLRLIDPINWPDQARLAASGNLDSLLNT